MMPLGDPSGGEDRGRRADAIVASEAGSLEGARVRIGEAFGTSRLILESGDRINGAVLAADLTHEASTLVLPVLNGQSDIPAALYERSQEGAARALSLIPVDTFDDGIVRLRRRATRR